MDTSLTGSRGDNYDSMQPYGYTDKEYTYEEVVLPVFVNIYILESGLLRVLYCFYLILFLLFHDVVLLKTFCWTMLS